MGRNGLLVIWFFTLLDCAFDTTTFRQLAKRCIFFQERVLFSFWHCKRCYSTTLLIYRNIRVLNVLEMLKLRKAKIFFHPGPGAQQHYMQLLSRLNKIDGAR